MSTKIKVIAKHLVYNTFVFDHSLFLMTSGTIKEIGLFMTQLSKVASK